MKDKQRGTGTYADKPRDANMVGEKEAEARRGREEHEEGKEVSGEG